MVTVIDDDVVTVVVHIPVQQCPLVVSTATRVYVCPFESVTPSRVCVTSSETPLTTMTSPTPGTNESVTMESEFEVPALRMNEAARDGTAASDQT
jgi:hypothetical protein